MKRVFRCGWSILETIIIIYVILVTSLILCKNKYGYTEICGYTLEPIGNSNHNSIKNVKDGDLVVIKKTNKIQEKDVVYYYTVSNGSYIIIVDSVIKVDKNENSTLYTVSHDDKSVIIDDSRVIGKKIAVYPFFGKFLEKVENETGFLLFVLLPIMIVFIYQVYEFFFTVHKCSNTEEKTISSNLENGDTDSLDVGEKKSLENKVVENKKNDAEFEEKEENRFRFVTEEKSGDDIEIL